MGGRLAVMSIHPPETSRKCSQLWTTGQSIVLGYVQFVRLRVLRGSLLGRDLVTSAYVASFVSQDLSRTELARRQIFGRLGPMPDA